jgi:hypothetical protein
MPSIIFNTNRAHLDIVAKGRCLPTIREFLTMSLTFSLTVFAWIFFRAIDVSHAVNYISEIFSSSLFTVPYFVGIGLIPPIILTIILFLIVEWIGREEQYAIAQLGIKWYRPIRWAMYYAIIFAIYNLGGSEQQFIYFQF